MKDFGEGRWIVRDKNDLIETIRRTLGSDKVFSEDTIDVDSLKFVEVIIALEEDSAKLIDIENIYQGSYETYGDLIRMFQEELE